MFLFVLCQTGNLQNALKCVHSKSLYLQWQAANLIKWLPQRDKKYFFIFVHEDGEGLARVSEIFEKDKVEASVDGVFSLDDVNKALQKVAAGGSKGKTIIKINQ